jgi:hypothetical protein
MTGMRTILALLLVTALAAGCGDDGDDDPSEASPAGAVSTSTTVRVLAADEIDASTPYCATWREIRAAGGTDTEGLTDEQAVARRKEYYGALLPIVERLLSQASEEIRPEVQRALDNTRDAAATGSFESFRTPASKRGTQALAQYALDNCAKG